MGKLKEKYLNNLSEDEMDEQFELSAFEYVEYMETYKHLFDDSGNPIEDVVYEQYLKEEKLNEEYWQEVAKGNIILDEDINDINDSMKLKYTDNDILYVLDGLAGPVLTRMIMGKLNDVWNTKNGIE
jgi:hypothetical protein